MAPPPRRTLLRAHMLTIGLAIAGAVAYAITTGRQWSRTRETQPLVLAAVAVALAVGLAAYLVHFIRKNRPR